MENLKLEKTNYIPEFDLNAQTGVLSIRGKSYPENTFEVYKPINEWIKSYLKDTSNEKTVVYLELTYLNSSSLKAYFDIFDLFEEATKDGKVIEISWIYESEDDIIEETGEDFIEDFESLKIKLVPQN